MSATIDADWCADHPLPPLRRRLDKEARGTLLVIGGSRMVPGATLLTGEAALRVGAGKVQIATVADAAIALGIAFPESAVIALPMRDDGEIAFGAESRIGDSSLDCSALVIGPGTSPSDALTTLVGALLDRLDPDVPVLLDAGTIPALKDRAAGDRTVIITPHHGECAKLMDCDIKEIDADPRGAASRAAERFGAIVALKDAETFVAAPDTTMLCYSGQAVGLGTAGSGDVLAGAIGGLLARGAAPITAIGWGVRVHGEAGRIAGTAVAPIGYLARELLPLLPGLVTAPC